MKRIIIGVTLLALLLGLVVIVQGATSKNQEIALQVARNYIKQLLPQIKFAKKVDVNKLVGTILATPPEVCPEGVIKVGSVYALYYQDDPANSGCSKHTFGWYSERVGCGALYPLVYGRRLMNCRLTENCSCASPHSNAPIGWQIQIPSTFGAVGFWLNWPYPPTGSYISSGGLYYTNLAHNWDRMRHALVFHWNLPFPITLYVTCDGSGTTMTVHELYLITFEDWCHLAEPGGPDWNDFTVALFH